MLARSALSMLRRLAAFLLIGAIFVAGVVLGAILHLGVPVARIATADLVQSYLNDNFHGTFEIGKLERLSGGGVGARDLNVHDPAGRKVLSVSRLEANIDPWDVIGRALSSNEKLSISIDKVIISECELHFLPTGLTDEQGNPRTHPSLVDAFSPRKKAGAKSTKSKRPVRVWFQHIALRQVYAHGSIAGSPVLETHVPAASSSMLVTEKGLALDVSRFGLQASGFSGVDTTARGEIHMRLPGAVWGDVSGSLGELPAHHRFRFENGHLDVSGHYPKVAPAALRPLLGSWPLDRTIAVDARIQGKPPELEVEIKVSPRRMDATPRVDVRAQGTLFLEQPPRAQLKVESSQLNVSRYLSQLPNTDITSASDVQIEVADSGPVVTFETNTQRSTVQGHGLPSASATGSFKEDSWSLDIQVRDSGIAADAHAHREPGQPITGELQLFPTGIATAALLQELLPGVSGNLSGSIQATLERGQFTSEIDLKAPYLAYQGLQTNAVRLQSNLAGNVEQFAQLRASTRVSAASLAFAEFGLHQLELSQSGSLLRPQVKLRAKTSQDAAISGSSHINVPAQTFDGVELQVSGNGPLVSVGAKQLAWRGDGIDISDFEIESIGTIRGNLSLHANKSKLDVVARGLNVSRISRLLGLARGEMEGNLDADIDLSLGQDSEGSVHVDVSEGSILGFGGLEVSAHANVARKNVEGKLVAAVDGLGAVHSDFAVELANGLLDTGAYHRASGRSFLKAEDIDLQTLTLLFGKKSLPKLSGLASLELDISREEDKAPVVSASLSTQNLKTEWKDQNLATEAIDLELAARLPPESDKIEAALRFVDPYGLLASVSSTLALPLETGPLGTSLPAHRLGSLFEQELNLVALLPTRRVSRLPSVVPRWFDEGTISARLAVGGSLAHPETNAFVTIENAQGGISPFAERLDVQANARYVKEDDKLVGSVVVEQDKNRLGSLKVDVVVPQTHASDPSEPRWTGTVQLALDNSPLEALSSVGELGLKGTAQGSLRIVRDQLIPQLVSDVTIRRIEVEGHPLGDAHLKLSGDQNQLVARLSSNDHLGLLEASAEVGVRGDPWFMQADPTQGAKLNIQAARYDAAVLLPFFRDVFDELSGPLSGTLRATITPPEQAGGQPRASFSGDINVTDATITPQALGLRFSNMQAQLVAEHQGEFNIVRIENISARADAAKPNVEGSALLRFRDLRLEDGHFEFFPRDMPLKSAGTKLAGVSGSILGQLKFSDERLLAQLLVDDLTAVLPETTEGEIIDTEENPTIFVVQELDPAEAANDTTAGGFPLTVRVNLGENVRLKNSLMDLRVSGSPEMKLDERFEVGGAVELDRGGRFVVLGRSFVVERGIVLFDTEDAANPHVQAVASWKAPNGVVVRVTVGGTLNAPRLEWSSEPALPGGEPDIIALVLGGGGGSDQTSVGRSSIAIAANELANVEGLEFYTTSHASSGEGRVARLTESSWDSYTAAYQISDELWFEGSFKSGTVGVHNETKNGVSGTLDWRFHPHWSARTEIGTLGAGLDMLWQYRY